MLPLLMVIAANMTKNPLIRQCVELVVHFLALFLSPLTLFPFFSRNRVDDMKLESFKGLETIPDEILHQGTRRITAFIRGLLVAQELEVFMLWLFSAGFLVSNHFSLIERLSH